MTLMVVDAVGLARPERTVLRVRGLCVNYGPLAAITDVDLDVYRGEVVGIAGDNGAGKSTLLRGICGDLGHTRGDASETRGEVWLDGQHPARRPSFRDRALRSPSSGSPTPRISVVWQHLVLSDNLDVAANLTLGKERHRLLMPQSRSHAQARAILDDLGIPIADVSRPVWMLSAAERQLLAVARSVSPPPRLLLLDEPTAVLSRTDSAHVETLIRRFRDEGTTILLISHDVDQLFRLAGRIVVLRHGRLVAQLDPAQSDPDELLALMAGHDASSAPRRQLSRLHGMADQLTASARLGTGDTSTGLTLILSTLAAALGTPSLSLHVLDGDTLRCVDSIGLPPAVVAAWESVPTDAASLPMLAAAAGGVVVVEADLAHSQAVAADPLLREAGIASWWAVPFSRGSDLRGVISVYRSEVGFPGSDDLDLINLYAGYAAAALERERLLADLTARNSVLETIRAVLQTIAGTDSLADGINTALHTLCEAVGADEVGVFERAEDGTIQCRASAGAADGERSPALGSEVESVLSGCRETLTGPTSDGRRLVIRLAENAALAAEWSGHSVGADERVLLEDAGHSILLAQERERADAVRREMAALRRLQEMQRHFLARLSHELRTPLTAIRGYASSLMQTDVTWDEASQRRFLSRISSESTRLRTLVDDLLDFSIIESGMLRVRPDWVDLAVVADAAVSCLSPRAAEAIQIRCADEMPAVWADHDRLEQVMVNLMDNAVRHNPQGTTVRLELRADGPDGVAIEVSDDGIGMPSYDEKVTMPFENAWRGSTGSATGGAGLGLLITRGIVDAHHGTIRHESTNPGTRYVVRLPVESTELALEPDDA